MTTTQLQMLDTATCPDQTVLDDVLAKGYAIAVYIGGPGSAGSGWTPDIADKLRNGFLPIYVPLQTMDVATGTEAADECLSLLEAYGRADAVALDLESSTVAGGPAYWAQFASDFKTRLDASGYRTVLYTSLSEVDVFAKSDNPPDAIWAADWVTNQPDSSADSHAIPGLPNVWWSAQGQRAWQYANSVNLDGWNWDISVIDSELVTLPESAAAVPTPTTQVSTYTVEPGNTLWGIAANLSKEGREVTPPELYAANAEALDAEARRHGYPNSRNGALIWPGTVLNIP
ncbi:MAG: LysM peptidoglycan-binding domain-containing protein [Acidobacteriaceae bacterium]